MMIFGRGCPGQWVEPCCGLPHLAEPTQSYFSEPTCYISAIWACPPIGSRDILAKCSQSYDHLMTIIFWLQVFWQRVGIPCFSLIIPLSGGAEIKPYFALFGSSAICTNSLFLCFHSALLVPLTASGLASLVSALSNGGKCGLVWWPLEVSVAHQVSETSDRESEDWHSGTQSDTSNNHHCDENHHRLLCQNQRTNPKHFLSATAPILPFPS